MMNAGQTVLGTSWIIRVKTHELTRFLWIVSLSYNYHILKSIHNFFPKFQLKLHIHRIYNFNKRIGWLVPITELETDQFDDVREFKTLC